MLSADVLPNHGRLNNPPSERPLLWNIERHGYIRHHQAGDWNHSILEVFHPTVIAVTADAFNPHGLLLWGNEKSSVNAAEDGIPGSTKSFQRPVGPRVFLA